MTIHGSAQDRADKVSEAVLVLAAEYAREGFPETAAHIAELAELDSSSLARLYNILHGVDH